MEVRIVAEHRGAYQAAAPGAAGEGGVAWCELTGRAFRDATDKRELPTVGDRVIVDRWTEALAENGAAVIRQILPRRGLLVRKAAGLATVPQPIAANVDLGLVLVSANGDVSPARLDRYLALLRDGNITPVIVLSKVDLVADATPLLEQLGAVPLSTVSGIGVDDLRARVGAGQTAVLLGSSGVGKSSLLNAMLGYDRQEVRPIRAGDDRGVHTTTRRELFTADNGSLWIDTPGMRELAQWVDDSEDEPDAFDDIAAAADRCKFRDCQHRAEPGCAVRVEIAAPRLASYHRLLAERASGAVKQQTAARQAATRRAKAKKEKLQP
jgi:ribosome biogenesis GTPase